MTITANQLLQLFGKVQKLGYTYDVSEDEKCGYEIVIRYWDKSKNTQTIYIDTNSVSYNDEYDTFDDVMEKMDKEFYELMHDKERQEWQERFKMYQKLQKEFGKN